MAKNFNSRLVRLESAAVADRGWRLFSTANRVEFFEQDADDGDRLQCADGNNPTDRRAWSQAELDALGAAGWQVIAVHWDDHWRSKDDEH